MRKLRFRDEAWNALMAMDGQARLDARRLVSMLEQEPVPENSRPDPDAPDTWSLTGTLTTVHWTVLPDETLVVWVRYNRFTDL